MKTIQVVAGIIEHNGKILCVQRGEDKCEYVAHKWEFPGGKIEPGETNEQALVRELYEELNIDVDKIKHFADITYTYPTFTINMYCYKCSTKSAIIHMNVHKNFIWLDSKYLNFLDWAPADQPIVKKLMAELD